MKSFLLLLFCGVLLASVSPVARAQSASVSLNVQADLTFAATDFADYSDDPLIVKRGFDGRYPGVLYVHTRVMFPRSLPAKHSYLVEVRENGRLVGSASVQLPANALFASYLVLPKVPVALDRPGVLIIGPSTRSFQVVVKRSDGPSGGDVVTALLR